MALPFQSFLESKPFTFVIGDGGKQMVVHAAAISNQSPVLKVMMEGPMRESAEGSAALPGVAEATFVRFCQYAYTGDYDDFQPDNFPKALLEAEEEAPIVTEPPSLASPTIALEEHVPEPPADYDGWNLGPSSKKKSSSRKEKTQKAFESLHYDHDVSPDMKVPRDYSAYHNLDSEKYADVYLGYARLYVFAEQYDIKGLANLTLNKLHKCLLATPVSPLRAGETVQLIQYCFANTPDLGPECDPLRQLVTLYVVTQVGNLLKMDVFLAFLEEGGSFIREFLLLLRQQRL